MRARVVAVLLVVFAGALLAADHMERTASAAEETSSSPRPYGVNVLWTAERKGTDGLTYVVGEISNDTLLPIKVEFLGFRFWDASGVSGVGTHHHWMSHLDPGERHPVKACLSCWPQRSGWTPTSYRVEIRYSIVARPANRFFEVEPVGLRVTNRNTTPATVRIIIDCVRGDRTVDSSLAHPLHLSPGETQVAGWSGSFTTACDRLEMTPDSPDPPAPAFTLAVSPTVAPYGTQATLSGHAEPLTSIAIESYDQLTGWTAMDGVTTRSDAEGAYSVVVPVTRMRWLRAVAGAGETTDASLPASSQVKGAVTLAASPATVYRGRAVTFSGSVRPALPGAVVQIQRYDTTARAWVKAATVRLSATSTYQWRWTPRTAGSYRFRTYLANQPTVTGRASAARTITVR